MVPGSMVREWENEPVREVGNTGYIIEPVTSRQWCRTHFNFVPLKGRAAGVFVHLFLFLTG